MVTKKIHLTGSDEALRLFGQHDQNLRALEETYGVQIFGRGEVLSVRGAPGKVEKALLALDEMRDQLGRENHPVGEGHASFAKKESDSMSGPSTYTNALGKSVRPRTANQKIYVDAISS